MSIYTSLAVPSFFAQAYGCDTYGQNSYNTCSTTTSQPSGGSSSLADTGLTVGIFIVIAAIIMILALAVRLWRRKKTTKSSDKN